MPHYDGELYPHEDPERFASVLRQIGNQSIKRPEKVFDSQVEPYDYSEILDIHDSLSRDIFRSFYIIMLQTAPWPFLFGTLQFVFSPCIPPVLSFLDNVINTVRYTFFLTHSPRTPAFLSSFVKYMPIRRYTFKRFVNICQHQLVWWYTRTPVFFAGSLIGVFIVESIERTHPVNNFPTYRIPVIYTCGTIAWALVFIRRRYMRSIHRSLFVFASAFGTVLYYVYRNPDHHYHGAHLNPFLFTVPTLAKSAPLSEGLLGMALAPLVLVKDILRDSTAILMHITTLAKFSMKERRLDSENGEANSYQAKSKQDEDTSSISYYLARALEIAKLDAFIGHVEKMNLAKMLTKELGLQGDELIEEVEEIAKTSEWSSLSTLRLVRLVEKPLSKLFPRYADCFTRHRLTNVFGESDDLFTLPCQLRPLTEILFADSVSGMQLASNEDMIELARQQLVYDAENLTAVGMAPDVSPKSQVLQDFANRSRIFEKLDAASDWLTSMLRNLFRLDVDYANLLEAQRFARQQDIQRVEEERMSTEQAKSVFANSEFFSPPSSERGRIDFSASSLEAEAIHEDLPPLDLRKESSDHEKEAILSNWLRRTGSDSSAESDQLSLNESKVSQWKVFLSTLSDSAYFFLDVPALNEYITNRYKHLSANWRDLRERYRLLDAHRKTEPPHATPKSEEERCREFVENIGGCDFDQDEQGRSLARRSWNEFWNARFLENHKNFLPPFTKNAYRRFDQSTTILKDVPKEELVSKALEKTSPLYSSTNLWFGSMTTSSGTHDFQRTGLLSYFENMISNSFPAKYWSRLRTNRS